MSKKVTTESFIEKAKEIYGDKYDYSKVNYVNAKTKVCIICPKHGDFWINPSQFISKRKGCPKCSNEKRITSQRLTTEQFIEKAKKIHGNKYDYSKTEYINSRTYILIHCNTCGCEFKQKPSVHLLGEGCPNCAKNKKLSTDEFISKVKEVHGNKYDYSKVNYINSVTKVCIICPKHGEFWQYPEIHLKGCGCPECANEKATMTTEQFIEKAKKIHGNKYDYSKLKYTKSHSPVLIHCNKCGNDFEQLPYMHLQGNGCPICANRKKKTTEEFIARAKAIHGDRYDYSKVNYVDNNTKVCIFCQKHGEFWQTPSHHLQGCNCPKCANEDIHNKQRHKKDEFIEKAKQVHGDKYDYSNVEYVNSKIPVKIFCKKHEKYFFQAPYNHVSGQGCPQCAIEKNVSKSKIGTDNFIKRAQNIHGDKYDYSKVNYINRNTKVNIHCNICGKDFEQTPAIHLSGHGCPYCANEKTRQRLLLTKEEFIKKAKKIHGDRYDYSNVEYNGVHKQIFIHCNKCGNDFWQDANSHLHGVGCPICQSSHLEEEMRLLLKENHIEFEEQKRFDWLGKQSLDFYIPSKNIAIECQGEQHYQSVKIFGGFQKFVRQKTLDIQKRKLCTENHVKIIYFTHFTKAIDNQSTFDSKEKILKKIY